jgi:hypothetical protein
MITALRSKYRVAERASDPLQDVASWHFSALADPILRVWVGGTTDERYLLIQECGPLESATPIEDQRMAVSDQERTNANTATAESVVYRHKLSTRIWHWLNAVVILTMLMSGLMIFNAHPRL